MKTAIFIILTAIILSFAYTGCSDNNSDQHAEHQELYYCPMHPEVTSNKPGVCPICNMDLVKRSDDPDKDAAKMEGMLTLSKTGQLLANVETVPVKREKITRTVNAFGYLDFTESGRRSVTSRFNGRIEKMHIDESGDFVRKGQLLFEIYSPDLIQAQNDYLLSLKNSGNELIASGNKNENSLLTSSKKRLQLMGLTDDQISNLKSTNNIQMTIGYYSPYSGTVIEKKVQEGVYVNEGAVIYELADLSSLWNIAEIFADDIPLIKEGGTVQFTTSAYPGEKFTGRVSFIYPVVNSQSRTVKVRMDVNNPGGKLKPQMYTESVIQKTLEESLVVPESAVLFTGERNVVWIKTNDNQFMPRDVKVGVKSDGKYQILSGLKEGELAAASGGYLIDSESQLKSGTTTGHETGHEPSSSESSPSGSEPSPSGSEPSPSGRGLGEGKRRNK